MINGKKYVNFIEAKADHFYHGMVFNYYKSTKTAKISIFKRYEDEQVEALFVPYNVKDINGGYIFNKLSLHQIVKFKIINNLRNPDDYQVSVIEKIDLKKCQITEINKSKGYGILADFNNPELSIKFYQKNILLDINRLKTGNYIKYITDDQNNCLYLDTRI